MDPEYRIVRGLCQYEQLTGNGFDVHLLGQRMHPEGEIEELADIVTELGGKLCPSIMASSVHLASSMSRLGCELDRGNAEYLFDYFIGSSENGEDFCQQIAAANGLEWDAAQHKTVACAFKEKFSS